MPVSKGGLASLTRKNLESIESSASVIKQPSISASSIGIGLNRADTRSELGKSISGRWETLSVSKLSSVS